MDDEEFANAEDDVDDEEFANAELSAGAGITPDSSFYFVEDKILSSFRSDLKNREKKIAEIEEMINEGKKEEARTALERYIKYAKEAEEGIDPDKSNEARRSAAAIKKTIKKIENEFSEEEKKEFIESVNEQESKISVAAEISKKIKDLCETLSEVDPKQYAEVCKTNEDAPKWHRELDKKLTEEQKKEAREFEKIMMQCMQTQGRECRCEDISIDPFAEKCSLIAPLATKCDEGDEEACEIMNEATQNMEELLPPHLQDVLFITEEKIRGEQFDHFMPSECKRAGTKNPQDCMMLMFKENAPEECVKAFEENKISIKNEKDARLKCEEIMFKENAPEECIEAGIKNPKECGTYMCENNLPEECKAAGLSCEQPHKVFRKCDEIMRSQGPRDRGGQGQGFALGRNCVNIQEKDEKLKCFEEAFNRVQQGGFPGRGPEHFDGDFEGRGGGGRGSGFPEECRNAGIDGRNSDDGERCRKMMIGMSEERRQKTRDFQENFARECRAKGGAWDCSFSDIDSSNPCRCYVEERKDFREFGPPPEGFRPPENFRPPEGQFPQPPEGFRPPEGIPAPPQDFGQNPPPQQGPETSVGATGTTAGTSTEATQSSSPETTNSGSSITGGAISIDNSFLDYYWK